MISNSSQVHIGNAKNLLMQRQNQYSTGKKIQRPSDDPTVAIKALQLRSTYSQIEQYHDRNVGDAMDWMSATEKALSNIAGPSGILVNMKGYLNQGANDPLDVKQRNSVLSTLKEYAEAVFEDEANQKFSGRYIFTGYRTDTSMVFPEHTTNLKYDIVQKLGGSNINAIKVVTGGASYADGKTAADYAKEVPVESRAYCMQLAYDNCRGPQTGTGGAANPGITIDLKNTEAYTNAAGTAVAAGTVKNLNVLSVSSDEANAYNINQYNKDNGTSYDAIFIYDKGEIVFTEEVYSDIQAGKSEITVNYGKDEFDKNDIRPEMYFECKSENITSKKVLTYADPKGQNIDYEVNFSQMATVNTQAVDAISTDIYRVIDYIERMVNEANLVEEKLAEVEKKIANTPATDTTSLANYNKLKEMLKQEQALREGAMTEAFGMGLTMADKAEDQVNVALADVGTRYKRLQMTEEKLTDQKLDTREQMSSNEDVEIADAYINMTEAYDLYTGALSSTAKILGNSLLNYI